MAVYRFKISFEDYEDVYREIDIRSDQKFIDLHHTILQSILFEDKHPASFFMSTDNWKKGKEISLHAKKDKDGKEVALMEKATMSNYIADPHQKIYYIIEGESVWTFHVELIKILASADVTASYPLLKRTVGEAPKQFKIVTPPPVGEDDEILLEDDTVEAEDEVESDEYSDEDADGLEGEEGEDDEEELDDVEMSDEESSEEEI